MRQNASMPLQELGYIAFQEGDYPLADRLLQEALVLCHETDYRRGSASALNILGRMALATGNERMSRSYLLNALATAVEIQAWPLVLDTLLNIAMARANEGEGQWSRGVRFVVVAHLASEKQTRVRAQDLLSRFKEAQVDKGVSVAADLVQPGTLQQITESVLKESAN